MHLAMGQVPIVLGNVKKNLKIMEESLKKAINKSEKKIDLIAFPELFITGYNLRDNYNNVSEKIPSEGPAQEGILKIAGKYDVTILSGIVERAEKSLFNSAVMIGPEGYIGHYRKQFLPNFGPFEEKTFFGEGNKSNIFRTKFGNIGVQICYDLFFPNISMELAQGGADLILNLAASPTTSRPLFHRVLPARAILPKPSPQCIGSPTRFLRSNATTACPASANLNAANPPAGPCPTTATSYILTVH